MNLRNLSDICALSVAQAAPGMPEWANLVMRNMAKPDAELGGGGIYACFWDEVLIYIGSFVGPKGKLSSRHVADRVNKHVIGLTLRARALGFEPAPLKEIIKLPHQIARDIAVARRVNDRLEGGSIKATYNKVTFAALHWDLLRTATPETLLKHFSFAYRRLALPDDMLVEKSIVKDLWIKPMERRLVERFKPICNTHYRGKCPPGPAVGFDDVAAAFEEEFTRPLPG